MARKKIDTEYVHQLRLKVDREIKGLTGIFETAMGQVDKSKAGTRVKKVVALLKKESESCSDRAKTFLDEIEKEIGA